MVFFGGKGGGRGTEGESRKRVKERREREKERCDGGGERVIGIKDVAPYLLTYLWRRGNLARYLMF